MIAPVRRWHPWALLAPTLLVLAVFFVVPLLLAVYRSFFVWDLLTAPEPVGVAHYRHLFASGELVAVTGRTLAFSALVVVGATVLGLGLALALDRRGRLFAFVRGAVFSAYVISWVSVGLLWLWILDGEDGALNQALAAVGVVGRPWLTDPSWALPTLAAVMIWKVTGYAMVIFLAGLQDIPRSVLEAATLDGAGPWARFRHVIAPQLYPTMAFVSTTSLIASFQAFDVVRVMTQGGPVQGTTVFVYAIYEQVFLNLRVGRASALTVVFFALLLVLTGLQLWVWRRAGRREVV